MKPILFIDFDGTLCHDRFWRSLEQKHFKHIQEYLFANNKETVQKWMRGGHTSEEINKMVAEELGMEYSYLWELFVSDCQNLNVSPSILEKINNLRKNYFTVLITDNMDSFNRFTAPHLNLLAYFDEIIESSSLGRLKNENNGQSFTDIISEKDSVAEKSILIDNSEKACKTFENLGGRSLFVDDKKSLNYWLDSILELK